MTDSRRIIETPRGRFELRPEQPQDGAFLFKLFHDHTARMLQFADAGPEAVENLIAMQFKSQTATYHSMYPKAAFSVIAWNGEDAGRIVEHDEGDAVYVVDVIFRVELQGKGLGAALIGALQQEWAARGRGARAMVMTGNVPSLRLWRKAGFTGAIMADEVHFDMRWYPPGHAKHVAGQAAKRD